MDKGASVGVWVARALDIVDQSGIPYRLNPMGTVLEGTWEEVMGVVKHCLDDLNQDCERITITMKLDHRKGKTGAILEKTVSVARTLGRKLNT
jgi:uncharacterized protein (TIGR00106 family)